MLSRSLSERVRRNSELNLLWQSHVLTTGLKIDSLLDAELLAPLHSPTVQKSEDGQAVKRLKRAATQTARSIVPFRWRRSDRRSGMA